MLEWSKVFNPLQMFFLHKLKWNWCPTIIAVCIYKEFSSMFNTLRMLESHFCKNLRIKTFWKSEILRWMFSKENKFCLHRQNFFVVLAKYYKAYEPEPAIWTKKQIQNKVPPMLEVKAHWESFFFSRVSQCINEETQICNTYQYPRWNILFV